MTSNKDLELVWFLYQTEGASKGISINSFCLQRGIPYNEFENWTLTRVWSDWIKNSSQKCVSPIQNSSQKCDKLA